MLEIKKIVEAALSEDIGGGDITSDLLFKNNRVVSGNIKAKEPFILCGIEVAREVFNAVNPCVIFRANKKDGAKVKKGDVLAELTGNADDLMKGERTALNFIQHLSGIATYTSTFVEVVRGSRAKIVDTRKTIPGLRVLEKYAVRAGGGNNHRIGLFDGILIKDNHIAACGGITEAVTRAISAAPHTLKVEVEVSNLDQVKEAIDAGADIIMLDNMGIDEMRNAVKVIAGEAIVEASGNITLKNLSNVASTGVDIISSGAITHCAPSVDISMKITV